MSPTRAAGIITDGRDFIWSDFVLEDPRVDEVLIRTVSSGLCHTDLSYAARLTGPALLGHEGAGVVERVGAAVTALQPGDRVLISFASCGTCTRCTSRLPSYCERFEELNFFGHRADGTSTSTSPDGRPLLASFFGQSSFGSYMLANARQVVRVPDMVPDESFRIMGPLGCAVQTGVGAVINALRPPAGSRIAIAGAGGVGLSVLLGAMLVDLESVTVVDLNDDRLMLASELGATGVLRGDDPDLVDKLRSESRNGIDFVIDTTGVMALVRTLAAATHTRGVVGLIGGSPPGTELVLDHNAMLLGRTLRGIIEGDADPQQFVPELIDYHMSGRLPFERLVTRYDAQNFSQAIIDTRSGAAIKPVFDFSVV
ncbi:MAG: aryl-alcohol dehydrogenase [Frankiales bacterium]|nr:aryl-alcohol dehydrogenase [Frankiales bacterium]